MGFNEEKYNACLFGKINSCDKQLSDERKIEFGFNDFDSIVEVTHQGYGFSNNDDILFTRNFDSCFVFFIYDDSNRLLFHLDSNVDEKDLLKIIKEYPFEKDIKVIVSPGINLSKEESEYRKIIAIFMSIGYNVSEFIIPFENGYVLSKGDEVIYGSLENNYCRSLKTANEKKLILSL